MYVVKCPANLVNPVFPAKFPPLPHFRLLESSSQFPTHSSGHPSASPFPTFAFGMRRYGFALFSAPPLRVSPDLMFFVSVGTKMIAFPIPTLFSCQLFLSVCLLHFRSLESVGTDLRCFLHLRFVFPPDLTVFRKRRYKNDALSVPTLFPCQLFLSGGINHTVSLLYFGNLPAFSALSFFGNLPVSLPSALSFFGKRRYRFALVSVPTLPISPD